MQGDPFRPLFAHRLTIYALPSPIWGQGSVGNADYAKKNKSYGLTTLRDRHVAIDSAELRFKGKSGKQWKLKLRDRRIAKIVKTSQDLPGQHLFQYIDEHGQRREVSSDDINACLKEISAKPGSST